MANERDAEIREIKLKIENLLVAANYPQLPQDATVAYLKELQVLRQRLHELGGDTDWVALQFLPRLPCIYSWRRASQLSQRV
jgi:hypothetical protein